MPLKMVLEHSLTHSSDDGAHRAVEHSLSSNSLSHLVKYYLISCRVEDKSPGTLDSYSRRLGAFLGFTEAQIISQEINKLTGNHVRLFLLSLKERGLIASTIDAYYRVLHAFFAWSIAEGVLKANPMKNIKPPRLPKTLVKPFTHQDLRRILALCPANKFLGIRNAAMVLVFTDTGLRLDEHAGIQLTDVDFDQETIRVMGKGGKERIVRIGKVTQKTLLRYLLLRDDGHLCLWVTEERRPMTRCGVQITMRKLCQRADIQGVKLGPHTFRHTAAINYLRNGGDIFTLQLMLGHSSLQMTRRYLSSLGAEDMFKVHRKASPVDNMGL